MSLSHAIIPKPVSVKTTAGTTPFQLNDQTQLFTTAGCDRVSPFAAELLAVQTTNSATDAQITLTLDADVTAPEGYTLTVTADKIELVAAEERGLFYGIHTLRQLLPTDQMGGRQSGVEIPAVTIEDEPAFKWRAVHLDVGRHMYSVEFIKKYIDLLALHKMNIFHWHLTEDQGWRIAIDQYPKLTEISAWRDETPYPHDRTKKDGKRYGGFYSKDEVREVVAYAESLGLTVLPEIELPGHTIAVLAAYPDLGCVGEGYKVRTEWGIEDDVFCAGNDDVLTFLYNVFDEVLEMFPNSPYIHIGGDECPKVRWESCPKCQARMEAEGLADTEALQSWFITKIGHYLQERGRKMIGWDEILEGGIPPSAAVMSWRGTEGGINAATQGHEVVMCPTAHCYFDYYQSIDRENEPPAIWHPIPKEEQERWGTPFMGLLPIENVYAFNPLAGVPEKYHSFVLGGQSNLWTEYIPTTEQAEYQAYPRGAAMAETLWSPMPENGRDFDGFIGRLETHLQRLDALNVNYRWPKEQLGEQ